MLTSELDKHCLLQVQWHMAIAADPCMLQHQQGAGCHSLVPLDAAWLPHKGRPRQGAGWERLRLLCLKEFVQRVCTISIDFNLVLKAATRF